MRYYKLVNNFSAKLAGPIEADDTEIQLDDAQGLFNDASDQLRYRLTLFETQEVDGVLEEVRREVVDVVGGVNNTLTVVRGADPETWSEADVEARLTAELVDQINANIAALTPEEIDHVDWLEKPADDGKLYAVKGRQETATISTITVNAGDISFMGSESEIYYGFIGHGVSEESA